MCIETLVNEFCKSTKASKAKTLALVEALKNELSTKGSSNAGKRKLIGKGYFTKAYQIAEDKVEIISICPAKECYALFSQGNSFAPTIEKIDYLDSGESVYRMPLYPKVTAPKKQLNKEAYAIYHELRKFSTLFGMTYNKFVEYVENANLSDDVKEEIISLAGDVANGIDCDDMGFEISPRNITTDSEGNLIMLDCFFSRKLLRSTYKK